MPVIHVLSRTKCRDRPIVNWPLWCGTGGFWSSQSRLRPAFRPPWSFYISREFAPPVRPRVRLAFRAGGPFSQRVIAGWEVLAGRRKGGIGHYSRYASIPQPNRSGSGFVHFTVQDEKPGPVNIGVSRTTAVAGPPEWSRPKRQAIKQEGCLSEIRGASGEPLR
jgi:hypothetical protein